MPGLVPGIHFCLRNGPGGDARNKSGHDDGERRHAGCRSESRSRRTPRNPVESKPSALSPKSKPDSSGLVPGISRHRSHRTAAWIPGTSPGMTEGALGCGRRTIACLLRKPIHVSLSCFVMVRGERPVFGRAGRAAVAACHGMSYLLMLCRGSDGGRLPGGRRGRGSGRERTWAAAPSFSSCSSGAPARYRSDPLPRAIAGGCGRVSAPARFARLIARARGRHRAHFACRLNRGRSAPGRRRRDAAPDAASLGPIIAHFLRTQVL